MYDLLKGLTIVEAAAFVAGPTLGLYFRQMGAEVIRIDQVGGGPDRGRWPVSAAGESLYWEGLNKGKRSVAIDLARVQGRELAQRIATSADGLFVTNFPVEGFLSYEKLRSIREDLICVRVMGWADGTPAVDYTVNAAVGLPLMTGHADDDRPVGHVLPAWDLLAGAYGAFALLAAERDRRCSGKGREIRVALSDIAASTLGHLGMVAETLAGGDRPRCGNDLFGAFGRDFPTADGERLMIVAITPRQWSGLVQVLGIGEAVANLEVRLGVSFTADESARFTFRDVLVPIVAEAVAARHTADLASVFAANGVCWSIFRSVAGALADEPRLFNENPIFAMVDHPSGAYLTPGSAARLPNDQRHAAAGAPVLGNDTDAVLSDLLNMPAAEIGRLRDDGFIA